MSESRDVIVIGGGMAGLTAALAAAEAGGDVLVLESEPTVGGSMAISGGLIWGPGSYELARHWIPRGNPDLQRIFVDELEAAWSWFEGHGLPLDPPVACLKDKMGRGRLMGVRRPRRARPVGGHAARRRAARGRRGPRRSPRRHGRAGRGRLDGDLDARGHALRARERAR